MSQLQFYELIKEIDVLKKKRKEWLEKTGFYNNKPGYIDFLLKITYDITDKDFEYFVAYILKSKWYTSVNIQWGYNDRGADISAKKNGQEFLIQCKQWASPYITMKRAWEFYGTIYHLKKRYPNSGILYITTSYINDEVQDFFLDHQIDATISSWKLVDFCQELGLFTSEWWEKLIKYIQQQRILKLRKELQKFLPVEGELHKLQIQRMIELRNHLSPRWHKIYINLASIDYSVKFFQYWNLG